MDLASEIEAEVRRGTPLLFIHGLLAMIQSPVASDRMALRAALKEVGRKLADEQSQAVSPRKGRYDRAPTQ